MNSRRILLVALSISAVAWLPMGAARRCEAAPMHATAVKDFTLATADGGNYSLAQRKGHRVLISFYKGFY